MKNVRYIRYIIKCFLLISIIISCAFSVFYMGFNVLIGFTKEYEEICVIVLSIICMSYVMIRCIVKLFLEIACHKL